MNQSMNQSTFSVAIEDNHQDHATSRGLQLHARVPDSTLLTFKTWITSSLVQFKKDKRSVWHL
jgi:hypothetical protein